MFVLEQLLDGVSYAWSVVPFEQVQREVESGRDTAGADEVAVVNHPGLHYLNAGGLEHLETRPVGDRGSPFQKAGYGESQRSPELVHPFDSPKIVELGQGRPS